MPEPAHAENRSRVLSHLGSGAAGQPTRKSQVEAYPMVHVVKFLLYAGEDGELKIPEVLGCGEQHGTWRTCFANGCSKKKEPRSPLPNDT